jgi:outer membrane protein OmpA-like peptidoglycan-associated protein
MNRMQTLFATSVTAMLAVTLSVPADAAECSLLPAFDQAIQAKDVQSAKTIEGKILADSACGPSGAAVRLQRATLEYKLAELLAGRPGQERERERLLTNAAEDFWPAANSLGELKFSQQSYAAATTAFEWAIELIKNPTNTPAAPGEAVIRQLLERASAARLLAANEETGSVAQYVPATRDFRGGVGGVFSADIRGVVVKSVPLPINFETGTDKPTPIGVKAEAELLQALKEQRPSEIIIVGHTDERGPRAMNMSLSEKRALAVARYLSSNGVASTIKTLGRGFDEPVKLDLGGLSREKIWALNRRVEWRRP